MRQADQDGEHIWLRQSVTFTANGQTRTVEMGIPLRPGAPAEEIERLLTEAEAGMQRISQRLDTHVAALLNGSSAPVSAPVASISPSPSAPSTPTEAPRQPAPPPTPAARPERPAPAPARAAAPSPAAAPPSHPAPAPTASPSSAASPTAPTAPARSRPSGPLNAPAPTSAGVTSTDGELSRKDFLAATAEMGLNVKQVMERLRVRSLEGLNLREALEALRRQMLRDGETMPTPPSTPAAPKNPPSAAPASTSPRYFEEEDDDVTFTMDGDDALAEEFDPDEVAGMPGGSSSETTEDLEDLEDLDALGDDDLDDVPDFGPPPSAAHASHAAHPPARRSAPAKAAPASSPPPSATEEPSVGAQPAAPDASPTARRIAQLRTVRGGGAPTTHQRSAYLNVVVNELGEPEAVALVRGLWRVNPERLGPEQLDALISWGKRDTFAEEAADVLAALRAERQQAAATAPKAPAAPTTPTTPAASRSAPRSRAQQQPRAPTGGR